MLYALFAKTFGVSKVDSANFFAFRMYGLVFLSNISHIFVTHKSVVHFNSSPIAGFALNRGKMELQSAKSTGWEQKRPNMKKDFQLWRRDSANGF